MSTRKPSATTAHPATAPLERPHGCWIVRALATGLILAVATACADGSVSDAERGKQQDAQRTSVVSDLQATHSARVLEPGTPLPSTPTPDGA